MVKTTSGRQSNDSAFLKNFMVTIQDKFSANDKQKCWRWMLATPLQTENGLFGVGEFLVAAVVAAIVDAFSAATRSS